MLNQFDGFNAWQVPGATNAEQIFILSFPHYNREKIEHSCLQFSNAFALPRPSTFLFGKPTASIEDAGMSVQLLRNALPLYVRIGESQTITFCDIQTDPCVPDFFLNKEDQSLIQLYCIQGDFASFSQLIRNLFKKRFAATKRKPKAAAKAFVIYPTSFQFAQLIVHYPASMITTFNVQPIFIASRRSLWSFS